jgi:hypothetical protein
VAQHAHGYATEGGKVSDAEHGPSLASDTMSESSVVETNQVAVALWPSLGFEILATVPEAFDHPKHGLVGLHVMCQRL